MQNTLQNKSLPSKKKTTQQVIKSIRLDEKTSKPYYQQLMAHFERLIMSGAMEEGAHLPSERDLAVALNLSRTTVKRCYAELKESGLLTARGRSGTQVTQPPLINPPLGQLKGFTQEMQELGKVPSTRVVSFDIVQNRTIASVFQRPSNASFLRIVRIRFADDAPMTREVAWYDINLAPQLTNWDTSGSVYAFLNEHCNIQLSWAEQSIEAVLSSTEETETFGFTENSPCLLLKRHTYSTNNQLIEYVEGTFRGDAYTYKVKLDCK
ncbi:MAG: GntR family transcriptional regulator [Methylotenera sp.]|nr:GntR family transcriptional regulator [Methylotenera sp.]